VVYFATGHYNGSGSDLLSMGVYKTLDAGATFELLAATVPTTSNTDWLRVTRVMAHPATPNLVFAGSAAGFFRSTDGGATWTKVSAVPTYEIAIDPANPANMLRGRFDAAVSFSTNTGAPEPGADRARQHDGLHPHALEVREVRARRRVCGGRPEFWGAAQVGRRRHDVVQGVHAGA
jgi:hypothetical protein